MFASPKTVSVLNLPVHLLDDYSSWLMERLDQNLGTHVITLNAEMAVLSEQNSAVAEAVRAAELVIPDGAGIVLYLRWRGYRQRRCPGIELAESLLRQIGRTDRSCLVAFYGGKPGIAQAAAQGWQARYPGLNWLANHGYLTPDGETAWEQTLQEKQPGLILVGLGVPRQEFWIREHRSLCPGATWIGVGGSFDIWSGTKSRAPQWFCENNLEWLYRLYQEPWRWRRMLALPKFFWRALVTTPRND